MIEKLEPLAFTYNVATEPDDYQSQVSAAIFEHRAKLNEIIDVVRVLQATHPKAFTEKPKDDGEGFRPGFGMYHGV